MRTFATHGRLAALVSFGLALCLLQAPTRLQEGGSRETYRDLLVGEDARPSRYADGKSPRTRRPVVPGESADFLVGFDGRKLSYPFQGLQQRLIGPTDEPQVQHQLLA